MSKKLTLLWIDDESGRIKACENLERALSVKTIFEDVSKKNLLVELKRIKQGTEPDLILIDHKLNKVSDRIIETGSTSAEIIREKWPECPIVCITAMDLKDIDLQKKSIYEELLEYPKLSKYYTTLVAIAKSFRKLKESRPTNADELLKLLLVPSDENMRIEAILSKELKKNYDDKSLLISIFKWVRHTLMTNPGFLYDQLWTATLLGIKESSFKKIRSQFEKARYKGIFTDEGNERWWQTQVKEILFSKFPNINEKLPWILARNLKGLTKKDFSKCDICGEDFPETVAYTDEVALKRKPMHIRCSIPHPNFKSSLFFEEIRMMKPAK